MDDLDMEKIVKKHKKSLSPIKSIKLYCKEMCCAGDMNSWKNCTLTHCSLYRYRLGHRNSFPVKSIEQNPSLLMKNEVLGESNEQMG
jgi:hypothetical protein